MLVGGGHAHLFVLEALAAGRFPSTTGITLVSPVRLHVYSGMLPGLVGGRYREEEVRLDLARLCDRAGAELMEAAAVGLDPEGRTLQLAGGTSLGYDLVSFAIGSTLAGAAIPGVAERAFSLKPIDRAPRLAQAVERLENRPGSPGIAVVGGGAGGIEIALNLRGRLRREGRSLPITLVDRGLDLLPGRRRAGRLLARILAGHGIGVCLGRRVSEVGPGEVRLEGGEAVPAQLVVWATGPAAPALFRAAGLATDSAGFLLVDGSLRSVSHPEVFAAGDAATPSSIPGLPKSGVHAVRQGPVLRDNLIAALGGGRPRDYRPRRLTLALLNTGDGSAVLAYGPVAVAGRPVMWLKDRIDRRFIRRFAAGRLTAEA